LRDLVVAELGLQYSGVVGRPTEGGLATDAADTLVEVWVSNVSLLEGPNRILYFNVSGGVQLRTHGRLTEYAALASNSETGHSLAVWIADDGERFKDELAKGLETLAEQIVDELLTRSVETPK
jgi:hypothetical protein